MSDTPASQAPSKTPKVFISYSHDSEGHQEWVLSLAQRLRDDGVDASLDQYVNGTPKEGWPRWMRNRLNWADYVLVVCTPTYYRRFLGQEQPGQGQGVTWEGTLITQEIYDAQSSTTKFVPVFSGPIDKSCIPEPIRPHSHYSLKSGLEYQKLCAFLFGEAGIAAQPLGPPKVNPRQTAKPLTFDQAKPSLPSDAPVSDQPEAPAPSLTSLEAATKAAARSPNLVYDTARWPKPSPFHNRTFPKLNSFLGRDALLDTVATDLTTSHEVALTQPVTLKGEGGVGKSRAAIEFARQHYRDYEVVLFLDCQSPDALYSALADVAGKLSLTNDPAARPDELVPLTLRLLRSAPSALVVADNVDTTAALIALRMLLREPGGTRFLITSRLAEWSDDIVVRRVNQLPEPDAIKLLQTVAGKDGHQPGSDTEAAAVAKELGYLPLALQQAAAYVHAFRQRWPAYLQLLHNNPAAALTQDQPDLKDMPESVLRTYTVSVRSLSEPARRLLEICAHLAPAPLPRDLFQGDEGLNSNTLLPELANLSLVEWTGDTWEIHRAVALATRVACRQTGNTVTRLTQACQVLTARLPGDVDHPNSWPAWTRLRPHVERALSATDLESLPPETTHRLRFNFPKFLHARGEYTAAIAHFQANGPWHIKHFGPEHSYTLSNQNNLANALDDLGQHGEAEREHRMVLEVRARVLGPEHPDTLNSRGNLAAGFSEQGRHGEAEREFRTVLAARERVLGPEHPHTLSSRGNLAIVLGNQGRHGEAEREHRMVLEVRARVLGPEHPATLNSRNNLAAALFQQGQQGEAEREFREVLAAFERTLGPEHPHTLSIRSNLAGALGAQGRHGDAERENRTVLAARERVLGPEHPDTLGSRSNLAAGLSERGRHGEAEREFREVLAAQERVLGPEHPNKLLSCYHLAYCLAALNRADEARLLAQRAYEVGQRVLGSEHPWVSRFKDLCEKLQIGQSCK